MKKENDYKTYIFLKHPIFFVCKQFLKMSEKDHENPKGK